MLEQSTTLYKDLPLLTLLNIFHSNKSSNTKISYDLTNEIHSKCVKKTEIDQTINSLKNERDIDGITILFFSYIKRLLQLSKDPFEVLTDILYTDKTNVLKFFTKQPIDQFQYALNGLNFLFVRKIKQYFDTLIENKELLTEAQTIYELIMQCLYKKLQDKKEIDTAISIAKQIQNTKLKGEKKTRPICNQDLLILQILSIQLLKGQNPKETYDLYEKPVSQDDYEQMKKDTLVHIYQEINNNRKQEIQSQIQKIDVIKLKEKITYNKKNTQDIKQTHQWISNFFSTGLSNKILVINGVPHSGKTTLCEYMKYIYLKNLKEYISNKNWANKSSIKHLSFSEFKKIFYFSSNENTEAKTERERQKDYFLKTAILILEDVDSYNLQEYAQQAFEEFIQERGKNNLPLILTCSHKYETFQNRLGINICNLLKNYDVTSIHLKETRPIKQIPLF